MTCCFCWTQRTESFCPAATEFLPFTWFWETRAALFDSHELRRGLFRYIRDSMLSELLQFQPFLLMHTQNDPRLDHISLTVPKTSGKQLLRNNMSQFSSCDSCTPCFTSSSILSSLSVLSWSLPLECVAVSRCYIVTQCFGSTGMTTWFHLDFIGNTQCPCLKRILLQLNLPFFRRSMTTSLFPCKRIAGAISPMLFLINLLKMKNVIINHKHIL